MPILHSRFVLLLFILIGNTTSLITMEITNLQPNQTVLQEVPSLKNLCVQYIGKHPQQVNLVENLLTMPAELTEAIIFCADYAYINNHRKELLQFAALNELDPRISSAIAYKLNDLLLAYYLAQQGPITNHAASFLVCTFLETSSSLDYFKSMYSQAFPKTIFNHGNYGRLYDQFITIMSRDIYAFECIPNDGNLFSIKDFEKNISHSDIVRIVSNKLNNDAFHNANLITLSACQKFCACIDDDSILKIYNLKTKTFIDIYLLCNEELLVNPCNLVFNKDCSQLGILCKDELISVANVPLALLNKELSLENLAELTYCKEQLDKQIPIGFNDQQIAIGNILFQNDENASMLDDFINDSPIVASFLEDFAYEPLLILQNTVDWSNILTILATELSMSKIEIVAKFNGNNPQFMQEIITILDEQDNDLLNETFFNQDNLNFFFQRIMPITVKLLQKQYVNANQRL